MMARRARDQRDRSGGAAVVAAFGVVEQRRGNVREGAEERREQEKGQHEERRKERGHGKE